MGTILHRMEDGDYHEVLSVQPDAPHVSLYIAVRPGEGFVAAIVQLNLEQAKQLAAELIDAVTVQAILEGQAHD